MTPPPKQEHGDVVELSRMTRAVIYGRGAVILIRGNERAITLDDLEAERLCAAREAFERRRRGEGTEES